MAQRVALVVHDDPTPPRVESTSDHTEVHFWIGTPLDDVLGVVSRDLDEQARAAVSRLWSNDDANRHVTSIGPGLIRVSDAAEPR